jgi:type IX secretion system PorP/SprF family membrane protein
MKNKILHRTSWFTCLLLSVVIKSTAQTDPHFTQNYTYPLYINPALTGSSDGDYRVSAIYRSQWGGVGQPYRTMGVSFDTRTAKNISLGGNILNQSAGDGGFNYLNAYASVAYTGVKLGENLNHRIVLAMQGGFINRRVNISKFKWGEQWNPITGYNSSNPSTETFARTSSTTLDIGAGALYYDASPDKKYNVFGGFSMFHINRPADPIISTQNTELNTIPLRYSIHGGMSINFSEKMNLIPHVLYMRQGNASEMMLGTYLQLRVNAETDIMAGFYYRHKDAVAPFIGFDYKNFIVGLSYDANTSRLGSMARNVNSFELSLTYVRRNGTQSIFDFIRCSRL